MIDACFQIKEGAHGEYADGDILCVCAIGTGAGEVPATLDEDGNYQAHESMLNSKNAIVFVKNIPADSVGALMHLGDPLLSSIPRTEDKETGEVGGVAYIERHKCNYRVGEVPATRRGLFSVDRFSTLDWETEFRPATDVKLEGGGTRPLENADVA